jgi:hypothetical protein
MIVSWLIFSRIFNPNQIKVFKEERKLKNNTNNKVDYKHKTIENILWFCILLIFLLFNVVPAVLIASNCANNNYLHLIIAFLFSDVYVFNYAIRKFIFRDGYCNV